MLSASVASIARERNRKIDDLRDGNGVNREKEIVRASKNITDDAYKYFARWPRGEENRKMNAPVERARARTAEQDDEGSCEKNIWYYYR